MAEVISAKADQFIRTCLDRARTRWVTVRFLEGLLRVVAATSVIVGASFVADNAFTMPAWLRMVMLLLSFTVFFGGLVFEVWSLAKRVPSDEAMARILEKKFPELDNSVINSVQLSRSGAGGSAAVIIGSLVSSTASLVSKFDLSGIASFKRVRQLLAAAAIAFLLLAGYAYAWPEHFSNAFQRFVMPLAWVAPITDTRLTVEPGDAVVGYGRPVTIIGRISGTLPSFARIQFRAKGGKFVTQDMEYNGKEFTYLFSSVTEDMDYFVEAGDAVSQTHELDVVILPSVSKIDLTLVYPDFTSLGTATLQNSSGAVNAPVGTAVKVTVEANVRLGEARVVFWDDRTLTVPPVDKKFSFDFTVQKEGWYQLFIQDADGLGNESPPRHPITIIPDKLPEIRIIRPEGDLTTSPERDVIISYQASDDFGVSWIEIGYRVNGGHEQSCERRTIAPGSKLVVDSHVWKMAAFKPNDLVSWFLRVKDSGSNEPIVSRVQNIMIVSESELRKRMSGLMEDLQTRLAALLKLQKEARQTSETGKALTEAGEEEGVPPVLANLDSQQAGVRLRCAALIDELTDPVFETLLIKPALQRLRSGLMITAMEQIAEVRAAAFPENRLQKLAPAMATQDAIIRELEKLLDRLPSIARDLENGKSPEEIADEFPERKAEWFKQKLEEFIEEQRKAIEMSRELARIPVEDWTEREQEMQRELEAIQEKWQKFFEENRDDFSRLPFQDFSDGRQMDEFVEIYHAVTKAYDAIAAKGHEIAVPLEQAGAEKAEELVHNLEAWFPDTPDRDKWSMEEPTTQDEIPMAELPEELEDMVGDLIEEEEDMADDIEDISSSWADSLDEGAGWDVMDGPISNMSAKGKTGNRLPNNHEIGGRSGEGRSGKSSGQFVEKSATGKGGRETPTRLTKDPYESGEVNDTSTDPVSGSSGGGKVSGQGSEGLQGPPPPEVQKEMGRLAGQQADLMARAQGLLHELNKRRFPTKDVERAIEEIKEIERQIRSGAHEDLTARIRSVVSKLKDAEKAMDEQSKINRERRRNLPQKDRDGISSATDENVPPDYKELVDDYYRALAEEGSKSSEGSKEPAK